MGPPPSAARSRALAILALAAAALVACVPAVDDAAPEDEGPTSALPWGLPQPPASPVPPELAEELAARFDANTGGVPGVSVAVITAEHGHWTAEAGTSDGTTPVEPGATFGFASTTKTFIAAAILRLVDEGRLSLDDPIAGHLPAPLAADGGGTTIAHHLAMASGIPDPSDPPTSQDPQRLIPPEEMLVLVDEPGREPGTFAYSNLSYYLLGIVLAEVSGATTAQTLRDGVIADDAFDRIVYQPEEHPVPPLALPLSGGEVRPIVAEHGGGLLMTPAEASVYGGSGAMAGPAEQLALWWYRLFRGDVVSADSLTLMTDAGEEEYGMGLYRIAPLEGTDDAVFANGGHGVGDSSLVLAVPDQGIVVAALTNHGGDPRGQLEPLIRELADALVGP